MQLVFAINVIITLLMLKPATSETCDYARRYQEETRDGPATEIFCSKTNTYLKELRTTGDTAGSCCKADDPSYANQLTHCLEHPRLNRFDDSWSFCRTGYFLNAFATVWSTRRLLRCCRPLHHPDRYGPCYYISRSRCQLAGYYITGFKESYLTTNLRCCKMTKTAGMEGLISGDHQAWVYANGRYLGRDNGRWNVPMSFYFPANLQVVAIYVKNSGGPAGLIASFANGIVTDNKWKCTTQAIRNWHTTGFDDSSWPVASIHGGNRGYLRVNRVELNAKWIGPNDRNANDFYCRRHMTHFGEKPSAGGKLCPRPWIYIEGYCYMFSSQSLSWNASKTACMNMESTLAVVDSVKKQITIAAKLEGQDYWIGLYRDPENTSRWLWIDSLRLCEGCGHWSSGQPDNYKANEGCGEMLYWYSGRWNDQSCSEKRRYICQKRVLKVTTTQQNITLDEGSTITLHCQVTLTEADEVWTFWLFNGRLSKTTHLQKARGTKTLSNTVKEYNMSWELKDVRLAQSGTYTCRASVTNITRTQNISLNVHDVLRLEQSESTVQITNGNNRTISCIAVYPKASNIDTSWLFNGRRKQTNRKYEVSDARFKRTEGTMQSRNISLTIYNAGLNDSGQYSCVLNTSHGLRLKNVSVQVVPDAIDKEFLSKSTTSTTSSRLQTRLQATQCVGTPSPSSNGVTDMDRHKPTLYTVLGLLGGVTIIIIPITLVIKFWYRRKYKPPASVRPPPDIDENDFKYDVFVTYSRKDFSWVDRELLRVLRENQVKYCVDHKHFQLGKAIVDNITDSVYQSRKVLAVWSGSYASSKYCKQELDYAIQRSFQNSDCSVIVITLDKTDRKQLPKPLRSKTFLDYSDSVERQGWEKRLIKHLKAPNYKKNWKTTIV